MLEALAPAGAVVRGQALRPRHAAYAAHTAHLGAGARPPPPAPSHCNRAWLRLAMHGVPSVPNRLRRLAP